MLIQHLYLSALMLLLAGSILPFVYGKRVVRWLSQSLMLLGNTILVFSSLTILLTTQTLSWNVHRWIPFFSFTIDKLAAFFILLTAVVSLCIGIYSFSYTEYLHGRKEVFIFLTGLFTLSLVLVVSSSSLLAFLFFWEMMSLTSFFLVMTEYEKKETQKAGIFYFVMTQFGTLFIMLAFFLIYQHTGSLNIEQLHKLPSGLANIIFVSLFIGFGTKAGVIPFHKWLPYAHPASPSPTSALMSGVMIKIAIYGLVRFMLLFPEQKLWWGVFILILGTISAFLGVIYALKEHDLKQLLAYHSIENIGIILMAIGLHVIFQFFALEQWAVVAFGAALFHTLNHALFKSLLFLSAGSVVQATHTRNIEEMGGLIKKMPYTAFLFLIGAVSISALPPFNGFASELMVFEVLFRSNLIPLPSIKVLLFLSLSLFAMTSALAAACFVKAFGAVFLALPRSKEAAEAKEAPTPMLLGPAVLALLCMGLGVFSFQIFSVIGKNIGYEFPLPNLWYVFLALAIFTVLVIIMVRLFASRKSRVSETWGCGILSQNSRMEYTASGFSEPIVTIFSSIYRTKKRAQKSFYDQNQVVFKEGHAEITLVKFFEEYLYLPLVRIVQRISAYLYTLQNKVELDSYILYSFITIIILMLIAGGVI